ncbi:MAG: nitrous oxide reductase family maturation protein NosD [Myxococcota bacterium]|jgi:nitrous oxidase accessory protein
MRRTVLVLSVLTGAVLAAAQTPGGDGDEAMALPSAANWGASWEEQEAPKAPNRSDVPWLQPLIDAAEDGSTLTLSGTYSGPVLMTKRLVLDGQGKAVIDGGGKGTVFTLQASGATLRGLTFTGSGESHSTDDTCLNVRGHGNLIENNRFEDCLFGVDLKQSNKNVVRRNFIRSQDVPLGRRGDALRLWYSMDNLVEENTVVDSRDMVVWYSNGNRILKNHGKRSRYSLHFMYAEHNVVEGNRFEDNSVGIYVMYTEGVEIRNNVISHSVGATGMGIGFKEASNSVVEGNDIVYCALGISSDLSPYQPDSTVTIRNNRIAYNGVGLAFTGDKTGTLVEGNVFEGNIDQVSQSGGGTAMNNTWRGNYWDDYQGFDRNRDGQGDTPYELYAFTDRIWMETPNARFFKNAPLMEALDFLERLAPFTAPELVLRDEAPVFLKPERGTP